MDSTVVTTAESALEADMGGTARASVNASETVHDVSLFRRLSTRDSKGSRKVGRANFDMAVVYVQKHWHGHTARKRDPGPFRRAELWLRAANLGAEAAPKGPRLRPCVSRDIYMALLSGAFTLQHGSSVGERFELVKSIKGEMSSITTPKVGSSEGGVTFD